MKEFDPTPQVVYDQQFIYPGDVPAVDELVKILAACKEGSFWWCGDYDCICVKEPRFETEREVEARRRRWNRARERAVKTAETKAERKEARDKREYERLRQKYALPNDPTPIPRTKQTGASE